ncbi:MAG: AbrB/MazE/SpoVT family DNA-binding domain-containing protein [Desulfovibrio sp.]|nr:AbrB/MazE/SpoVT family DNA-binding domain-containing protein [Desulfovibrio sp.]
MDIPLVPIGNSRGIRLPKALIAQCGFGDMVSLTVTDAGLLLSPVKQDRAAWEEALLAVPAAERAADAREFAEFGQLDSGFDAAEWTWPQKP